MRPLPYIPSSPVYEAHDPTPDARRWVDNWNRVGGNASDGPLMYVVASLVLPVDNEPAVSVWTGLHPEFDQSGALEMALGTLGRDHLVEVAGGASLWDGIEHLVADFIAAGDPWDEIAVDVDHDQVACRRYTGPDRAITVPIDPSLWWSVSDRRQSSPPLAVQSAPPGHLGPPI